MPSSNKSPLSTTIKSLTCGLILSQFVWGIPRGIYKWAVCGRGVRGQYRRLAGSKCWKRVASVRLRRCVVCKETQSSRCEKREPLSCRILPLVRNRNSVKRTNGRNCSLTSTGMTCVRLVEEGVLRVRSFCPCLFTMSTVALFTLHTTLKYSNESRTCTSVSGGQYGSWRWCQEIHWGMHWANTKGQQKWDPFLSSVSLITVQVNIKDLQAALFDILDFSWNNRFNLSKSTGMVLFRLYN